MLTIRNYDIEVERRKIQIDIIRNCIAKSKYIIIGNAAKNSLRNAKFFISRFPFLLPSENNIKDITEEINNRIYELKRSISISIKTLIGKRPIVIEDFFWFSVSDLKSGYVILYDNTYSIQPKYVLFLRQITDTFDGIVYLPGDIKLFKHVNHVLSNIKRLSDKELDIGFHYATKIELLKELSKLSSTLKSKKNESTSNFKT